MEARLRQALARAEEVAAALADPSTAADPAKIRALGREHTRLAPIVRAAERLQKLQDEFAQAREMAEEPDPELAAMARADLARIPAEVAPLESELHELLLPRDPLDDREEVVALGGDARTRAPAVAL